MEAFLVYILKASAVLAAFYLLWRFTLRGKTLHAESRVYLLVTMAFSFVVPLLVLTFTRTVELPTGTVSAGEPVLFDTQPAPNVGTVSVWGVLSVLYCVGAVAVLLYNIYAVASVRRLISSSSDAVLPDGTEVKVSSKVKVPFSFFSTMVVPENDMPSPDRALVTHEKAHVRLGHSADIQLCGAVCALQWFNPFVWLLRKDLRSIHEFQADAAVIDSGVRVTDYQIFLVGEVLSSGGYPLVSNLTSGNLKNRIDMMNASISSRRPLARLLLVLPLFAACLLANSRTKVVYVEPQGIQQSPQNDGSVPFQMVEVKPTFDGGDANKFSMWVNSQLVYPKEAKDNNIQGRVTLQFTVGKDGSVYGVKVLRGAHELLDNEAVRVVSASPKWSPGKMKGEPVAVTYTFPVIFQLKGDSKSTSELFSDPQSAESFRELVHRNDPADPDAEIFVDGKKFEGKLDDINPNDIKSITVLKDEAAKAMSGKADGVIMIVTKNAGELPQDESVPFQLVDEKPTFNGGDANEFSKWVNSTLVYPKEAHDKNIQGRVTLQFTVGKDGSVYGVKVLRGAHELLDNEAVRVVSASPKWSPGKMKGEPVAVTYTFPVIFQLKGDASEAPAGGIGIVKKDPGAPDPVIYLDGNKYEGNLSTIDPNTIESITVLKDEAALRQYDAPGGVILITTKETAKDSSGNTPFQMVEQKPTFGGGDASEFSKWVTSNLKYPEEAKASKVQGRVTVTFVVDIDGSVKDVKVLRGVNELLDAEAVRVISASPKWTPGRSKGEAVRVTYTFPVIFKLD